MAEYFVLKHRGMVGEAFKIIDYSSMGHIIIAQYGWDYSRITRVYVSSRKYTLTFKEFLSYKKRGI
jgi:hypothetical protein